MDSDTDCVRSRVQAIPLPIKWTIICILYITVFRVLMCLPALLAPNFYNSIFVATMVILGLVGKSAAGLSIMGGLYYGNRLAWQIGRLLVLVEGIHLLIKMVVKLQANAPVVLLLFIPFFVVPHFLVFFLLGADSAREYFRLKCPQCDDLAVRAADFRYRRVRCRSCQHEWD